MQGLVVANSNGYGLMIGDYGGGLYIRIRDNSRMFIANHGDDTEEEELPSNVQSRLY